jgi:Tfp pilus assembly protein PilZ
VDYSTPKRAYRDFIHDLSKSGLFIETREPFKIGESISLTFTMPGSANHFKISGQIVRTEQSGIGVKFITQLSRYQEEIIAKGLKK